MKRILYLFLVILIFCALCIPVYAHPGRTDSNGGHTDHSTGEYHYHHNQPAHEHYDMNGDGIIDCPYDFESGTDKENSPTPTVRRKMLSNETSNDERTKKSSGLNSYLSFCFMAPFVIIPLFNLSFYFDRKQHLRLYYIFASIAFLIWFVTFPVSTFPVLGYFHLRKK